MVFNLKELSHNFVTVTAVLQTHSAFALSPYGLHLSTTIHCDGWTTTRIRLALALCTLRLVMRLPYSGRYTVSGLVSEDEAALTVFNQVALKVSQLL